MNNFNSHKLTDQDILLQIKRGNKNLFGQLYDRYNHKVFEKCIALVKEKSTAEELKQEIFFKAFENLDKFQFKATFSTWLYAITYNHCIEYLRKKKKIYYPVWNRDQELPDIADEPEDIEMHELRYERLIEILDLIHPEEKAMLLMHYQDNIPVKMIMKTFKISESAAKMRLKRARARVLYLYNEKFKTL